MSSFTNSLVLEDTGDGETWRVFRGFRYDIGDEGSGVYAEVCAGTRTNLASIPRALRSVVPRTGRGNAACVLHDYLYDVPYLYFDDAARAPQRIDRAHCDAIFYEALRVQGASIARASVMYAGVRSGGWVAWERAREVEEARLRLQARLPAQRTRRR